MDNIPETTLELDQPREWEAIYDELFWASENIEVYNVFYPHTIFNQGAKTETRMGCSRYGIIHAINAQNLAFAKIDWMRTYEYNPEVMWCNYLKVNPLAEEEGATLQGALEQMVDLNLITWSSRLLSIDSMKQSLLSYKPIYTWSKSCNWSSVRDFKRYELGSGYAHIFCIIGFDGSGWIAINSYWPSNGVFHIAYEFTSSLFSCYSLSDSRDQEVFNKLKK